MRDLLFSEKLLDECHKCLSPTLGFQNNSLLSYIDNLYKIPDTDLPMAPSKNEKIPA